jgi:hypothetical protein
MRTKTPATQFQRSPAALANSGTSAVKGAPPIDASLGGHAAQFYRQAAERWRDGSLVVDPLGARRGRFGLRLDRQRWSQASSLRGERERDTSGGSSDMTNPSCRDPLLRSKSHFAG